jgi:hypothetical protein
MLTSTSARGLHSRSSDCHGNISEHWQMGTDGNGLENQSQAVRSSAAEDSEVGEDHSAILVDAFAENFSINAVERRVHWRPAIRIRTQSRAASVWCKLRLATSFQGGYFGNITGFSEINRCLILAEGRLWPSSEYSIIHLFQLLTAIFNNPRILCAQSRHITRDVIFFVWRSK